MFRVSGVIVIGVVRDYIIYKALENRSVRLGVG